MSHHEPDKINEAWLPRDRERRETRSADSISVLFRLAAIWLEVLRCRKTKEERRREVVCLSNLDCYLHNL